MNVVVVAGGIFDVGVGVETGPAAAELEGASKIDAPDFLTVAPIGKSDFGFRMFESFGSAATGALRNEVQKAAAFTSSIGSGRRAFDYLNGFGSA